MNYDVVSDLSINAKSSSLKFKLPAVEHEAHLLRIGRTAKARILTSSLSAQSKTRALNNSLSRGAFMMVLPSEVRGK